MIFFYSYYRCTVIEFPFDQPNPTVFHPDRRKNMPGQYLHQAATTQLTFMYCMCKRAGVAKCSHSDGVILDKPPLSLRKNYHDLTQWAIC